MFSRFIIGFGLILLLSSGCSPTPADLEGISVIKLESDWHFSDLAWSPDGHSIAATVVDVNNLEGSIQIIELQDNSTLSVENLEERTLYEAIGPNWSPDSCSLVLYYPSGTFVNDEGNILKPPPYDIVTVDAASGEIIQAVWDGAYATWGILPDEVIVVDSDIGRPDEEVPIFIVDLDSGETRQIAKSEASLITLSEGLELSSSNLLTYMSEDGLRILNLNTGNNIGIIEGGNTLSSPRFSPDGQILAYTESNSDPTIDKWSNVIHLVDATNPSCRGDALDLGYVIKSIDWSPDGKQIVFSTTKPGELYFIDMTTGVGKEWFNSYKERCQN